MLAVYTVLVMETELEQRVLSELWIFYFCRCLDFCRKINIPAKLNPTNYPNMRKNRAEIMTNRNFQEIHMINGTNGWQDNSDIFKHCCWNALIKSDMGERLLGL